MESDVFGNVKFLFRSWLLIMAGIWMVCGAVEAQSVIVKPTKPKPNRTAVHRTAPKPKPTVRRHVRTNSTPQRRVDQKKQPSNKNKIKGELREM